MPKIEVFMIDVGVDVDGVVGDFVGHTLNLLSKEFSVLPKREDIKDFHMEKYFLPTVKKRFFHLLSSPEFWKTIPAIPESIKFINEIKGFSNIVWVTSPWTSCKNWEAVRREWLKKNFPFKHAYLPTENKEYANCHILIDDKESNLIKWKAKNPNGIGILLAATYNSPSKGLIRLGWDERKKIVDVIQCERERLEKLVI